MAKAKEQVAEDQASSVVEVNEAELTEAADSGVGGAGGQIDIVLDMTMPISVRLGQAEIEIRELLQSGPGSVLQLDKKVGEPVDLCLHGTRFAVGSLVVVGEQLGVRIREILPSTGAPEGSSQAPAAKEPEAAG